VVPRAATSIGLAAATFPVHSPTTPAARPGVVGPCTKSAEARKVAEHVERVVDEFHERPVEE
jgi:hypothetical protein